MENKNPNFAFFGTPDVASETLEILQAAGYIPSLIVTAPDRPAGRSMVITPPPVKVWAEKNNVPYIQPEKIDTEEIRSILRTLGKSDGDGQRKFSAENFLCEQNTADFFIVVAYGKILSEEILNMPRLGSINIHYSLLPKYRGASPVEAAILKGETETGVSIQHMEFEMDAGPVLAKEVVPIAQDETAPELRQRLIKLGGDLLANILPDFIAGTIVPEPQNESQATFCKKIKKEDGLIDLTDDGTKNYNKFRAYAAWPRTFFFQSGKRVIITAAALENGKFIIKKVLPEGKKEIEYEKFISSSSAGL